MSDTDRDPTALPRAAALLVAAAEALAATGWDADRLDVLAHNFRTCIPDDRDLAAAEAILAAARKATQREPRVWLPGDTVPAGVWVVDGPVPDPRLVEEPEVVTEEWGWPVVEVLVPDYAAAVAAEQSRRAATEAGA